MDGLLLARLQFAITTVYHFFFVPLTLGLSILVAIMQTAYVRTGNDTYKRMSKFWGKLFIINFAMGVVTGIVQEFQFGMNWSEYSRFVGDIFGVPLAIEALLAFFLESTFLGIWIFGWDRLPKKVHLASIWLVAIGSNLSALWILIANSWMQQPVGYILNGGRAELVDFLAVLTNGHVWVQFPHTLTSGVATTAFFVLGISAYHILRRSKDQEVFQRSFRLGVVYALVGVLLTILNGHSQAQYMVKIQPMKMAAAEALYDTAQPASLSLFTIGSLNGTEEVFSIRVPGLLSFLSCNNFTCQVEGINDIQAQYEQTYGPGNYRPPIAVSYWTFRIMVGAGMLMLLLVLLALLFMLRNQIEKRTWLLKALLLAIPLGYIANTAGWLLAEVGRQPWIVFGLMRTEQGVSVVVAAGAVLTTLVGFTLLYGGLMAADVYLLAKFARKGTEEEPAAASPAPSLVGA